MKKRNALALFILFLGIGVFGYLQFTEKAGAQSSGTGLIINEAYYTKKSDYCPNPANQNTCGWVVFKPETAPIIWSPGEAVSSSLDYTLDIDRQFGISKAEKVNQGPSSLIRSIRWYLENPKYDKFDDPYARFDRHGLGFIINVLLGSGKSGNLPKNSNLISNLNKPTPDYYKYMSELEKRLNNPDLMFVTSSIKRPSNFDNSYGMIGGITGVKYRDSRGGIADFGFIEYAKIKSIYDAKHSPNNPPTLIIKSKSTGKVYGGFVFMPCWIEDVCYAESVRPFIFGDGLPPYGKSANITPWSGASEVKDIADIATNGYTFKQGIDTSNVKDTANDQFSYAIGGINPKNGSLPIAGTSPRVNDSYVFKPTTRGTWSRTISAVAPNVPYAAIGEAKTQTLTVRGWKVSGTTQVFLEDGVSPIPPIGVRSGQKITFIHTIKNVGEDINKSATHVAINLDVQGNAQTAGNIDCVVSAGLAYGAFDATCKQTVTVTNEDLDSNGKYCQWVSYSQAADNDQKPTSSAPACVNKLRM